MSTSSSKFRLLDLPHLAIQNVINVMDPDVLLDLSFSSKTFKSLLTFFKWKIDSFEWSITQNHIKITINKFRSWNIRILPDCAFPSEPITLNGTTVSLARYDCPFGGKLWYLSPANGKESGELKWKLAVLESLSEFLMSFVRCSRFKLEFFMADNLLSRDFFIWKHLNGASINLEITGIQGIPLKMSAEDLKFILEDVKCDNFLLLTVFVPDEEFKFEGILEKKQLVINGNSWINLNRASLNCERIFVNFGYQQVHPSNQYLRNWICSASLENLEHFQFHNLRKVNFVEVLNGIPNRHTQVSNFDLFNRMKRVAEDAICRDIQRESDGLWGTVIISKTSVDFVVWQPKYLRCCCKETKERFGFE